MSAPLRVLDVSERLRAEGGAGRVAVTAGAVGSLTGTPGTPEWEGDAARLVRLVLEGEPPTIQRRTAGDDEVVQWRPPPAKRPYLFFVRRLADAGDGRSATIVMGALDRFLLGEEATIQVEIFGPTQTLEFLQ